MPVAERLNDKQVNLEMNRSAERESEDANGQVVIVRHEAWPAWALVALRKENGQSKGFRGDVPAHFPSRSETREIDDAERPGLFTMVSKLVNRAATEEKYLAVHEKHTFKAKTITFSFNIPSWHFQLYF